MKQPTVNVRAYSLGPGGITRQNVALNPTVSLSSGLAAALPSLHAPSLSPAGRTTPTSRTSGAAVKPHIGRLNSLRGDKVIGLNPRKSAIDNGVKDGDVLSFLLSGDRSTGNPTYEDLQKNILMLLANQGGLEVALKKLENKFHQDRQFEVSLRILFLFTFLVLASVALITIDGFGIWGFHLDPFTSKAIVTSILGEVATLVMITLRFLYKTPAPAQ